MIKYCPVRSSLSASIKEEETFSTMEDMIHFLHDRFSRIYTFIGAAALFSLDEIQIGDARGDDARIGYRNVRQITLRHSGCCIGFCGE